ncbi:hypothetical protein HT105_21065 [Bacteroides fragilis]|nr:hypothetical protein [Bacteroides fragilis]
MEQASAADLKSDEGKQIAIAANTKAIKATDDAVEALTKASQANSNSISALEQASAANDESSRANSKAIEATNKALAATNKATEANSLAIEASNKSIRALEQASNANTKAIEATNQAVAAVESASAANTKAIEATNKATEANTQALDLLFVNNHCSLYRTRSFTFKANKTIDFDWDGRTGDMIGCHTSQLNGGGTAIHFDSAGDWDVRVRLQYPSTPLLDVGGSQQELVLHVRPGPNMAWNPGITVTRYASGYDAPVQLAAFIHIEQPGGYAYVSGWSNEDSATLMANNNPGPQYTEFSVRQLSKL